MDVQHNQEFFIPGLELISLTDDYEDIETEEDEPMIDWLEDCELQENLFQIIPLTPEETICDKDNHIIQTDQHVFFEELGYFCEEPEPIDPTVDYEADYKERMDRQQQQLKKNGRARALQRQQHVDLESIPCAAAPNTAAYPALSPSSSMDATPSPGLSSTSSSFHHTDDDHSEEDDFKLPLHPVRQSHLNPYHHHHHHHSSPKSKPIAASHFSFSTARF